MFKGIDVSKWQGIINWQEAKNDGVEFTIIREGYGKKSPSQIDKRFEENYQGAKAVGIDVGVYHYSYASSVNDAQLEAQFCLENIAAKQLEYPVCFDIEDSEMLALSTRLRTDICKAFCETIENAGYYVMIYCNLNWLNNYLYKDELLKKYDLWLAQWNVAEPSVACGIWQKSESGNIDGISANVDLNISYKDYPSIIKAKGLNGFSVQRDNQNNKLASAKVESFFNHKVVQGETLWELAQKYLGSGNKYLRIKELNNLKSDTIYVNQTLKIPSK